MGVCWRAGVGERGAKLHGGEKKRFGEVRKNFHTAKGYAREKKLILLYVHLGWCDVIPRT